MMFPEISTWILKNGGDFLCGILAKIFNKCIIQGVVPDDWKLATVIPLFKGGDRSDPGQYRPISLTSHIAKILEALIRKYLQKELENVGFFKNQGGFREGLSCTETLAYCTEKWWYHSSPSINRFVNAVSCDISKAFDRCWRTGLLWKLRYKAKIGGVLYFG